MKVLRLALGVLLASPITLATLLFYILPFWAVGWYSFDAWHGCDAYANPKSPLGFAPVWVVRLDRAPAFLLRWWGGWSGHCVGTAVVVKRAPDSSSKATAVLIHELHHVHQFHVLGLLQPILYVLSSFAAWSIGEDSYASNVFEMNSRRVAGQIVDAQSFTQGYAMAKASVQVPS